MNKRLFSPYAPRCGAHARTTGKPCRKAAMANGRCRNHGGKSLSGKGSPSFKHGCRTKQVIQSIKESVRISKGIKNLLGEII